MSDKELARKTIVERVLDKQMTQKKGAEKLNITERHFRRILRRYRQEGDAGLVSRKRDQPSNRRIEKATLEDVRKW